MEKEVNDLSLRELSEQLLYSARKGNVELLEKLKKHNQFEMKFSHNIVEIIHMACKNNQLDYLKKIYSDNAIPSDCSLESYNYSPILIAAQLAHRDVTNFFIEKNKNCLKYIILTVVNNDDTKELDYYVNTYKHVKNIVNNDLIYDIVSISIESHFYQTFEKYVNNLDKEVYQKYYDSFVCSSCIAKNVVSLKFLLSEKTASKESKKIITPEKLLFYGFMSANIEVIEYLINDYKLALPKNYPSTAVDYFSDFLPELERYDSSYTENMIMAINKLFSLQLLEKNLQENLTEKYPDKKRKI